MNLKERIIFIKINFLIFLIRFINLKLNKEFLRLFIKQLKGFFALREMNIMFLRIKLLENNCRHSEANINEDVYF